MKRIRVRAANGSYEILCGRGVLARSASSVQRLASGGPVFLLSSPRVWHHWGARVERLFRGISRAAILFGDREAEKNLETVEKICRQLVDAGADRRAMLVAVGGGVVGDVVGFVAASYARGVGLVHVPTTLVAQVDSAIGGKTGVNLPEGKNMVGAFYPPRLVLADPDMLRTLPLREYRSGIYEVIKYGVIGDENLFRFLEHGMRDLLLRKPSALDFVIERSAVQKARVVSQDEHESGLREILNFGHTFAHALESVTRYRRYQHGEAVGLGMIAASNLGVAQGLLSPAAAERITRLIAAVGSLPSWPGVAAARLVAAMQADKKTRAGKLRFVLPERIGKVRCGVEVEPSAVVRVLRECAFPRAAK
jgi:3-dehydroquinate synthase